MLKLLFTSDMDQLDKHFTSLYRSIEIYEKTWESKLPIEHYQGRNDSIEIHKYRR